MDIPREDRRQRTGQSLENSRDKKKTKTKAKIDKKKIPEWTDQVVRKRQGKPKWLETQRSTGRPRFQCV